MGFMSNSDPIKSINEAINAAITPYIQETENLQEALADVRMMMDYDEVGWTSIGATGSEEGLSLSEVKMISQKARTKVASATLEKRASDLHGGYVFGGGPLEIDGTERDPNKKGRPESIIRFYEDPINQENLFSDGAKKELQRSRFTDGNVIAFCDTRTKKVRRIPIGEIGGVVTNPDHPDEITAWLRVWNHHQVNGDVVQRKAWAYTNRHEGAKKLTIADETGTSIPVLRDVVAVDLRANRQTGWLYGIPDATAGMHWATAYGEVLRYGQIVNESLAKIVYKVVSKNQKTASNVGVKMRGTGAGGVAAVGEGQDIALVNSSQRSFDFTASRPLAAMAAAAWNVSNIDLLSDSSAAGSSYGAGNLLTVGVLNAMKGMQQDWTQFYQDIFEVLGFGRPGIHWAPMEKPDPYRQAQELTLYSVALSDEEYRAAVLDRLDIPGNPATVPPSLSMRNAEPLVQASPDQGKSSAGGNTDSTVNNDTRTDTLGEVVKQMAQEEYLAKLEALTERLEAATAK